jgi:hypothetical protein
MVTEEKWEKVEEVHKAASLIVAWVAAHPSGPSLSARGFEESIIEFANGKRGDALPGALAGSHDVLALPALAPVGWEESRRTQFIERHRVDLREHLGILSSKRQIPPALFQALSSAARFMLDPLSGYEMQRTVKGAKQRFPQPSRFYIPLKLSAVLAHGVLMFADERLGLGKALKRCAYCSDFFLAPSRGRPRLFCKDEHAQLHHQATTGPERTRKWRAKQHK